MADVYGEPFVSRAEDAHLLALLEEIVRRLTTKEPPHDPPA